MVVGRKLLPALLLVLVVLIAYLAEVIKLLPPIPNNLIKVDGGEEQEQEQEIIDGELEPEQQISSSSLEVENEKTSKIKRRFQHDEAKISSNESGELPGGSGVKQKSEKVQAYMEHYGNIRDKYMRMGGNDDERIDDAGLGTNFSLQELKAGFEKNKKKSQKKTYVNIKVQSNTTGKPYNNEMARSFRDQYRNATSKYCLTRECIQEIARKIARSFPDRPNKEEWCIPASSENEENNATATTNQNKHKGLILVKVPKAASSTAAGAVLRLGNVYNCNLDYVHWMHEKAFQEYSQRDPHKSFMIMSVRDPAQQMISVHFWYHVTKRRIPEQHINDDAYVIPKVVNFSSPILGNVAHYQGGLQTQFAALQKIPPGAAWDPKVQDLIHPQDTIDRIKAILDGYDFILVVERMDESLVAMSLVLNVTVGDVLTASTKISGTKNGVKKMSYTYAAKIRKCLPIRSGEVSPLLDGYLKSDMFRSQVYGDLILHAAANRSLDMTIERLGVDRFQNALQEYQYWKQKMTEQCGNRTHFPCSDDGKPQLQKAEANCYARHEGARDLGCGYECIDDILSQGKPS